MDLGLIGGAEMIGGHHAFERGNKRALRIGEERRDPGERFFLLGVENMEDGSDEEAVAGLLPMVAAFERAFGIDENVGDVLDIADFVGAATDLEQRVVMRGARIGRVEQQRMAEARTPACGQLPVLSLDVVDDRRAGPAEQRGHDQAHPLAASGWRKGHDMLWPVVAKVAVMDAPQKRAGITQQAGTFHLAILGPARRTIGGDVALLARAPQRAEYRRAASHESARGRQRAGLGKDMGRISIVMVPPREQRPRLVYRGMKAGCTTAARVASW